MNFLTFLTSRGFAICLLAVSIGFLIICNLYAALYSPLFLVAPALLFLSITFCTLKRVFESYGAEGIRFWGSVTFHIGLLVVIAATSLGPITRFWATVVLPEGLMVNLEDEEFVVIRSTPVGGATPFISFRLDWQETRFEEEWFAVDHAAGLTVGMMEGESFKQFTETIRINAPVKKDGYQLMMFSGRHTPAFVLTDNAGETVFNSFVTVSNSTDQEASFDIPVAGLTVYTRYFPDVYKEGDNYGTRSKEPKNPAFGIKVVKKKDPFRDIWRGVLKKGERAEFSGMSLEFADLKPVVTLQIMKDPTYWGIFAGWALIVAGLIVRYMPVEFPWKSKTVRGIKVGVRHDGYQERGT